MIFDYPAQFHKHDEKFLRALPIPADLKKDIFRKYANIYQRQSRQAANLYMLQGLQIKGLTDLDKLHLPGFKKAVFTKFKPTLDNDNIKQYAKNAAKRLAEKIHDGVTYAAAYCKMNNLPFPMRAAESEAKEKDGFVERDGPAMRRLESEQWLTRQLRKKSMREVEKLALRFGLVNKHNQRYVSDAVLKAVQQQKRRNNLILETVDAINNEGDCYTLAELSELSVSNPKVRNTELMVRLRGFDEYAQKHQHPADMWTITAPSKYHPSSEKWNGSTAAQTQQYLSGQWAKMRAAFKRAKINVYGFRVAEPHKDGCPHWHLLVFFPDKKAQGYCRTILEKYALCEVDRSEPGAIDHRYDIEEIDRAKGSAVGYIAKYITKNIDGNHITDIDGRDPLEAAKRVNAWASVWGIRQFQQIGGPSVTVWRELRRIDGEEGPEIEPARAAADGALWCNFFELQGGHEIKFRDMPIKPAYMHKMDSRILDVTTWHTYKRNQYGEISAAAIYGVICQGITTVTRLYTWTIDHSKKNNQATKANMEGGKTWGGIGPGSNAVSLPWTCVNNCTEKNKSKVTALFGRFWDDPYLTKKQHYMNHIRGQNGPLLQR